MSMLIRTCPHKPLRKIKIPSAVTKLTACFTCGLMSVLVFFSSLETSVAIHDTGCPYSDQVSLNNTNSANLGFGISSVT